MPRAIDSLPPVLLGPAERERMKRAEELASRGETGVSPLLDMLGDPHWAVRRAVVQALASLGEAAVEPLVEIVQTQRRDESRLAAAVDALIASTGKPDGEVIAMTKHPNPAVVADAAQILGCRRSRAGVKTLVALIEHENENVAVAAIEALGRIGGRSAVDSLVGAVRSRQFFRTFPAIDVLSRTRDPRAVAPLAELLEDARYCYEATRALGRTGDPMAIPALASLLARASDAVVRVAALALVELHRQHAERFGSTHAVEDALRSAAPPSAIRKLGRALAGASTAEQIAIAWVLGALGGDDAIALLTPMLDAAPPVAGAATEALERIGREATARITAALRDGDSATRRAILPALHVRAQSLAGVLACLDDPDPCVRASACESLARAANPVVVPALFERLSDPDARVVQAATGAIQSLGTADTERLALEAARSEEPRVRSAAFRILAYFGYSAALPIFLEALGGSDARLRDLAIQGLRFIEGPEAFEALLQATRHPEARARAAAMRALGSGRDDLRVQSALIRGLDDDDAWVRYYATQSLGRLGLPALAPLIAARLEDPAGQVRVAAIEALSHVDTPVATQALIGAAREGVDADVRRAALIGLGIARRPESASILVHAAHSDDPSTRLVAISALSGFEGVEVLDHLEAAARDPDESVRTAAVGFLAAREGEEPARRLVALLADPRLRGQALAALSRWSPARVRVLVEALARADDEQAPLLAAALARMQKPEARAALLGVLTTSGRSGRRAAAEIAAGLGGADMRAALETRASRDSDAEVRRVCALAITRWQR